jgi:hypothetical protein
MNQSREELYQSTGIAHSRIQTATFELRDLAQRIEYLHPKLADDLDMLAKEIEQSRKTIQGNDSKLLNMDLADSQRQMGEIFVALLDKAAG